VQAVFELFDKAGGSFTPEDHRLVAAAADLAAEMLRQALAQRQTHQLLLDAVGAALGAGDSVAESLRRPADTAGRLEQPPPAAVLDQLRQGLNAAPGPNVCADETLHLAEAIRVLALRHGSPAVQHCIRLVENLRELLDTVTGS
jgi:hypothetical protein